MIPPWILDDIINHLQHPPLIHIREKPASGYEPAATSPLRAGKIRISAPWHTCPTAILLAPYHWSTSYPDPLALQIIFPRFSNLLANPLSHVWPWPKPERIRPLSLPPLDPPLMNQRLACWYPSTTPSISIGRGKSLPTTGSWPKTRARGPARGGVSLFKRFGTEVEDYLLHVCKRLVPKLFFFFRFRAFRKLRMCI